MTDRNNPARIQLSRARGWRMPPNTVKVSRPGRWGNPFRVHPAGSYYPSEAVRLFEGIADGNWSPSLVESYGDAAAEAIYDARRKWVARIGYHPLEAARSELRGRNLACWCRLCSVHRDGKPLGVICADCAPCHADVLLRITNE